MIPQLNEGTGSLAAGPEGRRAPVAALSGVTFTYRGGRKPALRDVNLTLNPGEFVVILGASGAGKSTLCYCLNGLIPHFLRGHLEGDVQVFGVSTRGRRVNQLAELVGLVFQDFEAQLFSTNVELEVAFGPENFGVSVEEIRRRVAEALATVGLTGLERREPATLSGGQKQRLAIASVLSIHPRLLVMDEPTTDLDPVGKEGVFAVARDLRARDDVTLVIAEHEVEEAAVADRVVVLEDGRVVADGPPSEVLTRPDWLEARGVQPLGAAQLLARLGEEPALDVEEAVRRLRAAGWAIDPEAYRRLVEADARRAESYGEPIIEVRDLEHRYANGLLALAGVNLTIRSGEFVAVVGQNGSGKTTLVKHMNGLLSPTAGEVRVAGVSTAGQSVLQLGRTVGYVFQNPDHQIFAETVFDEVAFGPRNHGVTGAELRQRVTEALEAVGLAGREQEDPFAMTKGERQRVAVASVLATRPRVIILDEPTTGLDYREQRRMMDLVRRLSEAGHTILFVTHTMWVVAEYAHRTVVVRDGRIWMDGPTRQVMAREPELLEAHLRPPQLVRISNRLGGTLLSLDECLAVLRRGDSRLAREEA
ncbi:ABC transporter ATP-binding protein [Caldinitratiruptor microaerophilus]|uniref:Cobalt ABC transporter ATP-binding protein n=1 Tax=Caldinitratiruptor microaerophilus TaxID=671077 RepID=A0AA35CL51_9FIRM|nr:energy-coupling factor transporter ATPase [Caldinitratiruptor microaerophilus]BDG61320.1 cobalt ABC transporter ATP-binding protein [Caldinitratiruptor microaerophilus]